MSDTSEFFTFPPWLKRHFQYINIFTIIVICSHHYHLVEEKSSVLGYCMGFRNNVKITIDSDGVAFIA